MLSGGGYHSGAGTRGPASGEEKGAYMALFGGTGGWGISGGTETRAAAYLCVFPMFSRDVSVAAAPREELRYRE